MKTTLTIEQSARLIELGADKELANVCADVPDCDKPEWNDPNAIDILESQCVFSLESLLAILPKKITDRQRIYDLRIWVDHYSDNWCIEYTHDYGCNDLDDSFVSAEELIDAVYAEICFLKTNNVKEL